MGDPIDLTASKPTGAVQPTAPAINPAAVAAAIAAAQGKPVVQAKAPAGDVDRPAPFDSDKSETDSYTVSAVQGNLPQYRWVGFCKLCPFAAREPDKSTTISKLLEHISNTHGV